MDKIDEDATMGRMKTLLFETRSRLSEAFQEASQLGVWDSDAEVRKGPFACLLAYLLARLKQTF